MHYIKIPKNKELDLIIKLKYGEPNSREYLDKLPQIVIETAYFEEVGEEIFYNPSIEHKNK